MNDHLIVFVLVMLTTFMSCLFVYCSCPLVKRMIGVNTFSNIVCSLLSFSIVVMTIYSYKTLVEYFKLNVGSEGAYLGKHTGGIFVSFCLVAGIVLFTVVMSTYERKIKRK